MDHSALFSVSVQYVLLHVKEEALSQNQNADIRHLLDSLVSALALYATAFRCRLSLVPPPLPEPVQRRPGRKKERNECGSSHTCDRLVFP